MSRQQYYGDGPSTPAYPGINRDRSWDDQFLERGRERDRGLSSSSNRRSRPRSADARPQYNRNSSINMFYPTMNESRARLSYGSSPTYPSQLPKVSGMYHGDFNRGLQEVVSPGRSGRRQHSSTSVDPYQNQIPSSANVYQNNQYSGSPSRSPYSYESARDSLLMYGDIDHSSVGTGQSRQELIKKRERRDPTKSKKAPVVNLPPSLFPTHTTRQRKNDQEPRTPRQKPQQASTSSPPRNDLASLSRLSRSYAPRHAPKETDTRTARRTPLDFSNDNHEASDNQLPYEKPVQQRGWRGSMVSRLLYAMVGCKS